MKRTVITPESRDVYGRVDKYVIQEEEVHYHESETLNKIDSSLQYATFIVILFVLTLGLAPLWYFISKHQIKKAEASGKQPSELLLYVNRFTRIPAKIILVFYVISFVVLVALSIFGSLFLLGNIG